MWDLGIFIYLIINLQTTVKLESLILSGMTLKFKFAYLH